MVPASTAHNVRSRRSPPDCCNSWHSHCNLSMAISSQQVAIVFFSTYALYSLTLAAGIQNFVMFHNVFFYDFLTKGQQILF